jgi:hypothetical protein
VQDGFHKCSQNTENCFGFDFFQSDGAKMLMNFSIILRVTGDETWVSFVNVETKEQSKQWMHIHSSNKLKMFKQILSACQKADGNYFLGQERSADGGIHAKRDHNNVRSVLRNTNKTA